MNKTAAEKNLAYYETIEGGDLGYWKHMAAPRARVARALSAVEEMAPGSLCDFGCGNAALLAAVRERFPGMPLAGVDLSPGLVAANAARYPDMRFVAADLAREVPALPFAPEMGLSSEVIEHVEDPLSFLSNIRAALADQGTLFLSTQSGKIRPTEVHVGHVRHFTARELAALLRESGFSPIRVWNEGFPFHDLSKVLANLRPQATLARFDRARYGLVELAVSRALRMLFRFNLRTRGAQVYALARKSRV